MTRLNKVGDNNLLIPRKEAFKFLYNHMKRQKIIITQITEIDETKKYDKRYRNLKLNSN